MTETKAATEAPEAGKGGPCRCPMPTKSKRVSHCTVCHETFTSPGNFDRHRSNFKCLSPASLGMVPREIEGHACWGFEMDEESKAKMARLKTKTK